jgi:hypothetical protein
MNDPAIVFSKTRAENVDDGFEDMTDDEDKGGRFELEDAYDKRRKSPDSNYEKRRSFTKNLLQGKSGMSMIVDYTYDEQVSDSRCQFTNVLRAALHL